MAERRSSEESAMEPVVLDLPFAGRWLAQNSPARRVPSHGTDLLGERFAIDFVAVDDRRRSAELRDWRTVVGTEPVERFHAFGRAILAPVDGTIAAVHDGEPDHEGRRSQLALVPYVLGQASRLRMGVGAVAGNHLVLAIGDGGAFVGLAHLKCRSILVSVGDRVAAGQPLAECGNSGNSTEPHLHLQVMDDADLTIARGLPMAFRRFREWPVGARDPRARDVGIPGEGSVVETLSSLSE